MLADSQVSTTDLGQTGEQFFLANISIMISVQSIKHSVAHRQETWAQQSERCTG